MRYSQLFGKASKTTGANLTVRSHQLLVQAGYIRESVAGRYYFLPLGLKTRAKIIDVIRSNMDASGAQEVLAPTLHPLELWRETNRDQAVGFELMQVKDRRGAKFALAGTAEEMFVDLVRKFNHSHKDLPINLYQFGLKFRDEARARGGLLRVREFVMKDAYSFSTEDQFTAVYQQMATTYSNIFTQVGLETTMIEADGGYIGGDYCHEFVVDSAVGESLYLSSPQGYAAHEDVACFDKQLNKSPLEPPAKLKKVPAKRGPTMADSERLHAPASLYQHLKNVVYINEHQTIIVACLRGDLAVNETKLGRVSKSTQLRTLTADEVADKLNSTAGFISPVGLQAKDHQLLLVVDDSVVEGVNYISGANVANTDYVNINLGRDFQPDIQADIALAEDGHLAIDGGRLQQRRGIEVGNIFQLGYHYSQVMKGATYSDQAGQLQRYYMGCYGIGVGRTLAAIAEVKADNRGLVWPAQVSPYLIYLIALGDQPAVLKASQVAYQELQQAKQAVLYDDRPQISAGQKLTNFDLLGLPIRIIISQRSLAKGQAEVSRTRQASQMVDLTALVDHVKTMELD